MRWGGGGVLKTTVYLQPPAVRDRIFNLLKPIGSFPVKSTSFGKSSIFDFVLIWHGVRSMYLKYRYNSEIIITHILRGFDI